MKKLFLAFLILFVLVSSQYAQAALTIRIPHCCAQDSHFNAGAETFAQLMEKYSCGEVQGQVFLGGQLGQETEVIQNVQAGTIEATFIGHDPLIQFVPEIAILSLPYLFKSHDQALDLLRQDFGKALIAAIEKKGFKLLGFGNNGARVYTNNTRPINTPGDFKGLKMRSPQNPVNLAVTEAFGGIPVAIPYGEVYTAIQQKTIDGQENAVINIYPARLYEVQKHMAMTNHLLSFTVMLMNKKLFDSLPTAQQEAVSKAATEALAYQSSYAVEQADEMTKRMEQQGVVITRPNMEIFRALVKPVHDAYVGKTISKELYDFVK